MIGGYLDGDRKDLKLWRVLSLQGYNFIAETSEHGTIVAVYDKSAAKRMPVLVLDMDNLSLLPFPGGIPIRHGFTGRTKSQVCGPRPSLGRLDHLGIRGHT